MRQHNKRWQVPQPLPPEADASLAAYHPVLRQILFNRGYPTAAAANAFLNAEPPAATDPYLLTDMQAAVDRVKRAVGTHEPIAVYGDYDVDGVTATALLMQTLRFLEADVRPYIPRRFDEGYGLNTEALDSLKANGVRLVITVDCGIRSPAEALHAKKIGLDLIITDHHHPAAGALPEAAAVINPKQVNDPYPDKDLAGVGIAYKLAEALLRGRPSSESSLRGLLDLVALGTVADLAPLVGENRHLVRRGLLQIRETSRQGLFALAGVAEVPVRRANARHIGFALGPRLNAAGRLETALDALELLTTSDVNIAGRLAQQLDVQNRSRQALTRDVQAKAESIALGEDPDAFLLFAADPEFNSGVVGLAASRLSETYYRPAIVGSVGPEETRASCRSIPEFHITDALDACSDLLIRHGGHAAAAGFTVRNEKIAELVSKLKSLAAEKLGGRDLRPLMLADAEVPLTVVRPDLIQTLSALEPTGYGNPDPALVARSARVKRSRTVGTEGSHLKLVLEDAQGFSHDGIGFRLGHLQADLPASVDVLFNYEINEFNGRLGYQLNVRDLKPAGTPD